MVCSSNLKQSEEFHQHVNIKHAAEHMLKISQCDSTGKGSCYCTCDDVLQGAVLPLAYLRLLPLLQLGYQVHLWHLRHHWTLGKDTNRLITYQVLLRRLYINHYKTKPVKSLLSCYLLRPSLARRRLFFLSALTLHLLLLLNLLLCSLGLIKGGKRMIKM